MFKRAPVAILGFVFLVSALFSISSAAQTKGCYLLKVNIWNIEDVPQEIQDAAQKQVHPNLSSKYGSLLRSLADTSPSPTCADSRDKKTGNTNEINTAKLKRSQDVYTVEVTPRFKDVIQVETVEGIAKVYFIDTEKLQIKVVDPQKKVISPKLGYMTFDASEWVKDLTGNEIDGYVMSVHFFVKK